jgi:(S)-2-hydroxyglutarate dehydrogenase
LGRDKDSRYDEPLVEAREMLELDLVVVGAGIVGLGTAYALLGREPGLKVAVLEKDLGPATHQTGRNSGVIHSGIYYRPGSLKASTCRAGRKSMIEFCAREGVAHEICGKVIVATSEAEDLALTHIHERSQKNGVVSRFIDRKELRELEPNAAGERALHVPEAGIVDFMAVCRRLVERIGEHKGSRVVYSAEVCGFSGKDGRVVVHSRAGDFSARHVVNCAGLQSDRVTALTGEIPSVRIVPFKGEYFTVRPSARRLVNNLVYPVPDPRFPFLGVHFTRGIDGSLECGPNAILALGREAYGRWAMEPRDLAETLGYPGFLRLASRFWRVGAEEMWRSVSKAAFVRALGRLVPAIEAADLVRAPAGIRAQAVAADGSLVDDFLFQDREWVTNVCNAPSPAATASLEIGSLIADRALRRLHQRA